MYLIYYQGENTKNIECLNYVFNIDEAKYNVEKTAQDFILKENGEKLARECFDYPLEKLIEIETPDGLHLIKTTEGFIDMYKKSTKLEKGMLYGVTPTIIKEKLGTYCFTEMKNFNKKKDSFCSKILIMGDEDIKQYNYKITSNLLHNMPPFVDELKEKLLTHKNKTTEEIESNFK